MKASYHTLGCKLNFAETATLGKMLASRNITRASEGETPDIVVVNTCSVTEMADKKGRQLIRRLVRQWPDATMIVTGCYAQLKPEEVSALPGVDIVLGADEKMRMAEYLDRWMKERLPQCEVVPTKDIKEFHGSCHSGDRTRWFLKVQDGCDYFCTYCTIPFARGRSRSGLIEDLVSQASKAADEGAKEIVITGVNTGCFGLDTGESFFDLLKRLDEVKGIERYRISSIEPNLLTEDIVRWIAEESRAFMPHFHVPLQSGSDRVLKLMNRRYDTALFRDRMEMIRQYIPDAFIGVDVIAGARGETEEEWQKAFSFIKSLPVSQLHVFPYSERPGTAALKMDAFVVSQEEKHHRVAELTALSDRMHSTFRESQRGKTRPVLWEHPEAHDPGIMSGFTDNYLRVTRSADTSLINRITEEVI